MFYRRYAIKNRNNRHIKINKISREVKYDEKFDLNPKRFIFSKHCFRIDFLLKILLLEET